MKLTKNILRNMILQEIRISIARSNLALEEDEELEEELGSGMTSYLDTEASNTTYTTSHGYKGDNMSTIAEDNDSALEIPHESQVIAKLEELAIAALESAGGNEEDPYFIKLNQAIEVLKSENPHPGNLTQMASWK